MQILATILFFIVFIEIFVVLSVYLGIAISTFIKQRKEKQLVDSHKDEK